MIDKDEARRRWALKCAAVVTAGLEGPADTCGNFVIHIAKLFEEYLAGPHQVEMQYVGTPAEPDATIPGERCARCHRRWPCPGSRAS